MDTLFQGTILLCTSSQSQIGTIARRQNQVGMNKKQTPEWEFGSAERWRVLLAVQCQRNVSFWRVVSFDISPQGCQKPTNDSRCEILVSMSEYQMRWNQMVHGMRCPVRKSYLQWAPGWRGSDHRLWRWHSGFWVCSPLGWSFPMWTAGPGL